MGDFDIEGPEQDNPDTSPNIRCQFTWNPGTWPYTKRCENDADTTIVLDGEELHVCIDHSVFP